jgi:acetyl-CoA carboxylase biotin carboxyl carrier protein
MTLLADDIAELTASFSETGLAELHITGPGTDLHLVRSCTGVGVGVGATSRANFITAPGPGIFLTCHPLHTTPLADPGRFVRTGQVVALLRVGLVLRPVQAPGAGHISAPSAEPGTLVGYGTTLFSLQPVQPETQE